MLANLVDMEESVVRMAVPSDAAAAIFFDSEAAFPSLEQERNRHSVSPVRQHEDSVRLQSRKKLVALLYLEPASADKISGHRTGVRAENAKPRTAGAKLKIVCVVGASLRPTKLPVRADFGNAVLAGKIGGGYRQHSYQDAQLDESTPPHPSRRSNVFENRGEEKLEKPRQILRQTFFPGRVIILNHSISFTILCFFRPE